MGRLGTALLALSTAALAQDQRPVPAGSPDALIGRSVPVHVVASEELEPDVLRALARPGVTLWLTTRSNTLRESTLDTLNRFEASWVQLRLPLAHVDGAALARSSWRWPASPCCSSRWRSS